jgi:hypothetical protein
MPTFTRKNAWNHNGTFDNTDLLWYAKAVQVMQNSPVSNPISWWSYAAIHGEFLILLIPPPDPGGTDYRYLNWTNINYISPSAALDQLPSTDLTTLFWDQCQHGTWFFAPWHRGYLAAIENILRDIIVKELNGPSDWALPYWNYLNQTPANPESNIPPAFTVQQLPDGTANPLYVPERYGKKINVGGSDVEDAVNDECQWDTVYNDGAIPFPSGIGNLTGNFYGGGETNFEPGGKLKGDLEDNPHNGVHGMVGGNRNNDDDDQMGLMGVPNTAALDPIFYLHHANIDRMWAAWNEEKHNSVPLLSEYDGLRFIFDYYALDISENEFADSTTVIASKLKTHYVTVSAELGYKNAAPETLINYLAYDALGKQQFNKAKSLFELNQEWYPESSNVYDSYAAYFLAQKDTINAIANYRKALAFDTTTIFQKKLDALIVKKTTTNVNVDLQKYAGTYTLETFQLDIVLAIRAGKLWAVVPGQEDDELQSITENVFTVKGKQGYTITFQMNGDKPLSFTSVQPNGTFKAVIKKR